MHGKTVLITGGNAGLGYATATALARRGASVVIAARDEARGRAAVEAINRRTDTTLVRLLLLDLASFASVRNAAERFLDDNPRLDVLINNAGVFAARLERTRDGFELQFGVNHLGPFLLSHLLLPALAAAPAPRLVNVASRAHHAADRIDFDDLRGEKRPFRGWRCYARSKLANVLFTREWSRRFPGIPAHCFHPGTLGTAIGNKHGPWYVSLAWSLVKPFLASPERGAAAAAHLATSPAVAGGGRYFDDRQRERRPSRLASDDDLARRLWEASEELTADGRLPPLARTASD